jgi:serpin B
MNMPRPLRILSALAATLALGAMPGCSDSPEIDEPQGGVEMKSALTRVTAPDVSTADLDRLVADNTDFALDMYRELRKTSGNFFYSPHSVSIALAMTWAGARGDTEAEMASALHFSLGQERLHPAFNALDLALASRGRDAQNKDGEPFALRVVNALWGQQDHPFRSEFLDELALNYGAGVRLLDFVHEPEPSRIAINDWVAHQTEDRIRDLIAEGSITPDTRLVLTNAIYFNAAWATKFEPELTRPAPFQLADGTSVTVPTMSGELPAGYAAGADWQAVELPYDGGEVSMVIVVPEVGQLEAVEGGLDASELRGIVAGLQRKLVSVSLPKFEFTSAFSLVEALQALGMREAFSSKANLSGIDGTRDLSISDVIHKAFVAVDESGTEAAAATAVVVGTTSAPGPDLTLVIDRPFLIFIRDIQTGAILFAGRVVDPR